ncbi:hypothetical protein GGF44_002358 [Coemansia sp. RSA 1694]|nr:hypothetical protein GGI00_003223 [Coemansia sp. RSA 2681]KAJ2337188.1 hypothetical protein GGI00_000398 [Coemansia sp. RSA 2681]KAJ2640913.1 hypothetical protein GGF44_002358 [Coemansia sp. RSA 1694]
MRFFIVLALFTLLVALASAFKPATDFVMLMNDAYKDKAIVYTNVKSDECKNVDKAFNKRNTSISTKGRAVELYAGPNCTKRFSKSPASSYYSIVTTHAIMSFKVKGKK